MIEVLGAVFAIGFFGLVTQRTLLRAILSLHVMANVAVLGLVAITRWRFQEMSLQDAIMGRAQDAALLLIVFFQIQTLLTAVYVTRLRRQKHTSVLGKLNEMRN